MLRACVTVTMVIAATFLLLPVTVAAHVGAFLW